MPPRSPHHLPIHAAEALVAVAPLATRWIERLLAGHEPPLTLTQYLAMRAIAHEGVSGTELARRAGVSGAAISQLLASLADARLIEREPLPADRRRNALMLSRAGERTFRSADALLKRQLGGLLREVPGPELDALTRQLPRVASALSGAPLPRRPPPAPPPPGPSGLGRQAKRRRPPRGH